MNFSEFVGKDPGREARWNMGGPSVGIVTNNQDPDGLARVKVKFPWLGIEEESDWARIVTPMAGGDRGLFILPEVDDEVLVMFEFGDMNRPIVMGALWNGVDTPPDTNENGENNLRFLKSRSGHVIRLDDTDGAEKIEIIDKTEKNLIVIDTAENKISITSEKDIDINCPNGTLKIDAKNIEMKSSSGTKSISDAGIEITASGNLDAKGATINLN